MRAGHEFGRVVERIRTVAFSSYYNFKPSKVFSPIITKSDISCLKNLGQDKNIIVCSPDKGRGVVIVNRTDYLNKMSTLLNDATKFRKLVNDDPFLLSVRLEDRINNFLNSLKNSSVISEEVYRDLYATGSSPGALYGLAKIHKPNIPFRPILAAYNTATYKIAKFLVPLIEPFTINEYSVRNSYAFYDSLKELNDANISGYMVSFDITSLYTNIPVKEAINILSDRIFETTGTFHGFDRGLFTKLLDLITSNTLFFSNCAPV